MRKLVLGLLPILGLLVGCGVTVAGDQPQQFIVPVGPMPAPVFYADFPTQLDFCGEPLPLHYPDVVESLQREISVTMFMHSSTMRTLRAMDRYFAIIVPMLVEAGVPEDFKYLAMAESGLNPEAISTAKASGLWQIMSGTGRNYGLLITPDVDMRYNIEEATKVAIRYLLESYKKYGNWTLSAASYNLGPQGVSNRMSSQKVDNYYDLFMPEETMRYLYRIMALKVVSQNPSQYGFHLNAHDHLRPFENYTTVEVSAHHIDWVALAQKNHTTYKMLRLLNPWIRSYSYANPQGRKFQVKVPTGPDFRTLGH